MTYLRLFQPLGGDTDFGCAACVVGFVAEVDDASVGFDDLAGEGEAYC